VSDCRRNGNGGGGILGVFVDYVNGTCDGDKQGCVVGGDGVVSGEDQVLKPGVGEADVVPGAVCEEGEIKLSWIHGVEAEGVLG
jgi:hypothetical protein